MKKLVFLLAVVMAFWSCDTATNEENVTDENGINDEVVEDRDGMDSDRDAMDGNDRNNVGANDNVVVQPTRAALQSFQQRFPNATDVKWEHDDDGYEVEFEVDGEEMEAQFSSAGEYVAVEPD